LQSLTKQPPLLQGGTRFNGGFPCGGGGIVRERLQAGRGIF